MINKQAVGIFVAGLITLGMVVLVVLVIFRDGYWPIYTLLAALAFIVVGLYMQWHGIKL